MTSIQDITVTRRDALKTGGALIVSFGVPAALASTLAGEAKAAALARPLSPGLLDTYLAIASDGAVTV
jgi:hypothetical protein